MFPKFPFACLVIVLCLSASAPFSFAQTPQARRPMTGLPLPKIHFPAGKQVVEIPFEVEGSWMVLPVRVNGSRPLRFVLDTGAQGTILQNPGIADSLKLNITGKMAVRGAGSGGTAREVSVVENVSFDLGGIELSNARMMLVPSSPGRGPLSGHDGAIGRIVFASLVVEVDWEKQVLRFYDPSTYMYKGSGTVLPLTFDDGGRPYTMASVAVADDKPIAVKVVVDTGGSHALSLDTGPNSAIKVPEGAKRTVLGRGASGEFSGFSGRVKALELGGHSLRDVPAIFPDASSGITGIGGRQGSLGGAVLRRFKTIYDYAHERMIVEPNQFFQKPFGTPLASRGSATSSPTKPAALQDYIGIYGNKEISIRDGKLFYQRSGGWGAPLRELGKDEFALNDDAHITFVRGANGIVSKMQIKWVDRDEESLEREPSPGTKRKDQAPNEQHSLSQAEREVRKLAQLTRHD